MARMGHDSERAAMIYQHAAGGADDAITEAMDSHVEAEQVCDEDGDNGAAGALVPARLMHANCTRGNTKISKAESRGGRADGPAPLWSYKLSCIHDANL